MHQQLVIVFLVGLVASTYGLDLSHAAKRSTELEPRLANLFGDLYAQIIYPPLNQFITKLALLCTQLMAKLSQNGISSPDGRTLHPSEDQLRGFFSGLWNDAIKPPIENALSGISLLAAQLLAGIGSNGVNLGIGKRDLTEAEMRGFADAMNDVFTSVIQKPLEDALAGGALLLAQVLAGLGTNGVNLGSIFGKRDLTEAEMRGFIDALNDAMNSVFSSVIQKPLEDALSGGALLLAQALAGLGTNGVNLASIFGKRDLTEAADLETELRGIFSTVGGAVVGGIQGVWNNIFQVPLENFVQNSALTAAGWFANFGTNGVNLG